MSNILVTGGCGYIGSRLVEELLNNQENKVVVLENTENISKNIICLPMHPFLTYADIEMIVNILRNIHINAEEIKKRVIQDA